MTDERRSYTINSYQGNRLSNKFPLKIIDNQIDTNTTIPLPGRSVPNYGKSILENFVWLMENFAGPNPPHKPTIGQTWFYTQGELGTGEIRVFNGVEWKPVGPVAIGTNFPRKPWVGEVFYNSANQTFYIWDGNFWVQLVGSRTLVLETTPSVDNRQSGDFWYDPKEMRFYVFDENIKAWLLVGPMSGYPLDFSGQSGKILQVNSSETGFNFVNIPSADNFFDLLNTPNDVPPSEQHVLTYDNSTGSLVWSLQDIPDPKDNLIDLNDTPTSYGIAGQILATDGSKFVFKNPIENFTQLKDTPDTFGGVNQYLGSDGVSVVWKDLNTSTSIIPPGTVWQFAGTMAPSGWLICNGQMLDTSLYPALFAAIGYAYTPTGAPANMFALPDLQGRSILGAGSGTGLSSRSVGDVGGFENSTTSTDGAHTHTTSSSGLHTHTINVQGHSLTEAQLPPHTHDITVNGNPLEYDSFGTSASGTALHANGDGAGPFAEIQPTGSGEQHTHAASALDSGSHSHNVSSNGNHEHDVSVMHPFLAMNFIIKI